MSDTEQTKRNFVVIVILGVYEGLISKKKQCKTNKQHNVRLIFELKLFSLFLRPFFLLLWLIINHFLLFSLEFHHDRVLSLHATLVYIRMSSSSA